MRILHVITSLRTGGAERLLVDLLPRLRDCGHDVSVLLFDGTMTPFYAQLQSAGIPIHALGMGFKAMHNPLIAFRLMAYLRHNDYDIVHTHNTPCQLLTAAVSGGRFALVTTEHNTYNRRSTWGWYRSIDRWMYGRYRHVICVSNDARQHLAEVIGQTAVDRMTSVVYNGIDTKRFTAAKPDEALRKQYDGCRLVVMVAAFRRQKDQPTLIRAIKKLPDEYRLLLVGNGECRSACEALAVQEGVSERVIFTGIRTDIPEVLASADVVVMSSRYEGLSLSSIEGLSAGKPFIASDVDGLREIVGGAGLLFPPHDHVRLAALIRRCCEDADFAQKVGESGRRRAAQYDIDNTLKGYNLVYQSVVINN